MSPSCYRKMWAVRGLSNAGRLCGLALCQLATAEHHTVTCRQTYLVWLTGLNQSSITRSLRELEDRGLIQRWQRDRRSPTEYTLTL